MVWVCYLVYHYADCDLYLQMFSRMTGKCPAEIMSFAPWLSNQANIGELMDNSPSTEKLLVYTCTTQVNDNIRVFWNTNCVLHTS